MRPAGRSDLRARREEWTEGEAPVPGSGRAGSRPPVPRVAGAPGPRGNGRDEPATRDQSRLLRVLARIIADLYELASYWPIAEEQGAKVEDAEARRIRHRQRLAEPEPPPKRLSMREERTMLQALLDLPPSERG